ncbi:MAG: carbon-nitrogen hydrolase family protein [Gammaproteobacteria bacterium]|nr:carbon-nitrogen hydrolase family protein [Gammaproteobacteria bacterium]
MTHIAAIQMVSGTQVDANLTDAARLIAEAAKAGARLIALPENFALMAGSDAERLAAAEPDGDGPIQAFLARTARANGVWLIGGTILLRASSDKKMRAASLLYNDRGERVARYDKIHLFDVQLTNGEQHRESSAIEPGDAIVTADTPAGRVGLSVCYDVRFPELFRRLLDAGSQILVVPAAFTAQTGRAHWETLLRARAIENLAYVLAPGQGGHHANGRDTYGHSMIIDPWGEVLSRCEQGPGMAIADCDLERQRRMRAQLPSIEHRRVK